jgi:hypothetical protein
MSPRQRVNWGLVLTLAGLLAAWGTSSCRSYAEVEHRISVVETKEDEHEKQFQLLRQDLRDVRGDLKQLLERQP